MPRKFCLKMLFLAPQCSQLRMNSGLMKGERMRASIVAAIGIAVSWPIPASAQNDPARQFGAREAVQHISLSPGGTHIALVAPGAGQSTTLFVTEIATGKSNRILTLDGKPQRLSQCNWLDAHRLVCTVLTPDRGAGMILSFSRAFALNMDGSDPKQLTASNTHRSLGTAQFGGSVIDWLAQDDGSVLMTRQFVPTMTSGSNALRSYEGLGVERIDTTRLTRKIEEAPRSNAVEYISDGHGEIRVRGDMVRTPTGYSGGEITYFHRTSQSREWQPLSKLDLNSGVGFNPYAVDRTLNVVYGFDRHNGRQALYRISLDGRLGRELVFAHPQVDVDGLIQVGRERRVVGVTYATDKRTAEFFDPKLKALAESLGKALPDQPLIRFVDASEDESKLLLWAGSDVDPGRYYLYNAQTRQLGELLLARPELQGATLAPVKAINYPASDGTIIPGYLTLPAGSTGKGVQAIVLPHGGPGARDEWGFDWLAQYFAAKGYAVLQPNFRGSSGYGDAWFQKNGFQSWETAIGDVNAAGRWLISEGIADARKLAIVGWSYGGYAALQSGVVDPGLFKALVAIAPVTDLHQLKEDARNYSSFRQVSEFVGARPHIDAGSPARHVDRISAPVLLVHGDMDANVHIGHSELMTARLKAAGKSVEFMRFADLDHQLDDTEARRTLLDRSDLFIRAAFEK